MLWHRKHFRVAELAKEIWGESSTEHIEAATVLLRLGSLARLSINEYPLLPHRLHLMTRPPAGMVLCLNEECSGDASRKPKGFGRLHAEFSEHCSDCGGPTLSLVRCDNCGQVALSGKTLDGELLAAPILGSDKPELFSHVGNSGQRSPLLSCPNCDTDIGSFSDLNSSSALTISIVAETLLAELPPIPALGQAWLPARGRRLLAFSDSRQAAARLGPRLTRQHESQLIRAAILRELEKSSIVDEGARDELQKMIDDVRANLRRRDLSDGARRLYETQLKDHLQLMREYEVGGSIQDWADVLRESKLLAEVLDRDTATSHVASSENRDGVRYWSQRDWERNLSSVRANLRRILAREFARPSRRVASLETFGLVEITYPGLAAVEAPRPLLGVLPDETCRASIQAVWPELLAALCDTLRSDGAVRLSTTEEFGEDYWSPTFVDRWCAAEDELGGRLVRFVGSTPRQRRRWFAQAILIASGVDETSAKELAPDLLRHAFRQLLGMAESKEFSWIHTGERQSLAGVPRDGIQILFDSLGIRKAQKIYRCRTTGHVWLRSILGCAPEIGCIGTLEEVEAAELDQDGRIGRQRREYADSAVFSLGLWAEEHSAQLSQRENRRLQDLFRSGIRNILSATTTLELGIDIGGLNAVLMTNVPPGKSNYLQRAGRSGRRSDGSSIVVTFCSSQPYDREVFHNIGQYLERPLRKPMVFLDRPRVVERHLNSHLLGSFFKLIYPSDMRVGAMRAFGDMGRFCGVDLPGYWKPGDGKPRIQAGEGSVEPGNAEEIEWWDDETGPQRLDGQFIAYVRFLRDKKPDGFVDQVTDLLSGTTIESTTGDWQSLLDRVMAKFTDSVERWRFDYLRLLEAWKSVSDNHRAHANTIRYQLKSLYNLTVIEAMADFQFLPHYGFRSDSTSSASLSPMKDRCKFARRTNTVLNGAICSRCENMCQGHSSWSVARRSPLTVS